MAQLISDTELRDIIRGCGNDTFVDYTPLGGALEQIYMVIDHETEPVQQGDGSVSAARPEGEALTIDLTTPVNGATVVNGAKTYTIEEVFPDVGEGMTRFGLKETT